MDAFFLHISKSSCLLFLFLLAYYAFLKKETFFTGNRLFLIIGLLTSVLLPFISLTKTIYVQAAPASSIEMLQMQSVISNGEIAKPFDWYSILLVVYILGTTYFTCRLLLQLRAIRKIKNNSEVVREDNFYHVQTHKQISPFSFFKHIFYNPFQYSDGDLKTILTHEKVHAKGLHSLDILLTEMICILQWFNPAAWFYRTMVKQNLEFLADSKTCSMEEDKRNYQYLMLRQAVGNHKITIVNPFFNSIIKKRIVMLNQNQSQRINLLKLLIILPFLVLFLVGFNTKEVVKFSHESSIETSIDPNDPIFSSPLKRSDILRISSGFGLAKSPFSHKMKNHTGIDIVARAGKEVTASAEGTVAISNENTTNGNYVVIAHENGYSTKYLHLKDRTVEQGDVVKDGEIIGHVGNTGKSTGTHLHFEILKAGRALNPESLVPFKTNRKLINSESKDFKKIELVIDKDTSDEKLLKIKTDLAKDKIDFSYTTVRNESGEIRSLEFAIVHGNNSSASYASSNEEDTIEPAYIFIDTDSNSISVGKAKNSKFSSSSDAMVWISKDNEDHKEIRVKKVNGKKIVVVDGKEVDEEDLDDMEIHMDDSSHILIHTDSDDDDDIKVIGKKGNSFFFIDTEEDKEPLYIVDGEESSSKKVKRLNPDEIESIDVSKGKAAVKKYGKKAKDGVVEITTKKN